jgi:hypothetical protein
VTRALSLLLLGSAAIVVAAPAAAQTQDQRQERSKYVQPYIELTQVATADLSNGDDVLTYTQVAAGIDAGVSGPRADAQISYRSERRIQWDDRIADDDVHSGLARVAFKATPAITLDGGALATRSRTDIRGAAPGVLAGNVDNITQVYSVYGGPNLATSIGPVQAAAAYHAAYTKVEAPGATGVDPDQPRTDYFDSSVAHLATASLGVAPGSVLPVGVTLSGAYEREDAHQLDQTYEGYFGRGDVVLPLTSTFAIRGGVGYEKITAKQKDPLLDADGNPVTHQSGRFVTDANSPVRIAYNTDGLIYDGGVIWRPSPRLELQANAGYRYGGETYTGSLQWQVSRDTGVQVVVYDGIETFGRQLRDGIRALPTNFQTQPDGFGQQFNGCVFGSKPGEGGLGAGGCLNSALQSVSSSSYRARGVDGVVSIARGRTSLGFGAGYANRKLYTPDTTPDITIYGTEDQSAYAQAFWSRALTRRSTLDANLFANWYSSGITGGLGGTGDVWGGGATGSYSLNFGHLGTVASLGVYGYDQADLDTQWSAQALLGARYTF